MFDLFGNKKIKNLERCLTSARGNETSLSNENFDLKSDKRKLQEKIGRLEAKYSSMENSKIMHSDISEERRLEISSLEKEISCVTVERDLFHDSIKEAAEKLITMKKSNSTLESELDKVKRENERLRFLSTHKRKKPRIGRLKK